MAVAAVVMRTVVVSAVLASSRRSRHVLIPNKKKRWEKWTRPTGTVPLFQLLREFDRHGNGIP